MGGVSRWTSPHSARRGKSTASYPYTVEHPYDIKRFGPRPYFPPPKPRAVLSARHTSKVVEYPQPSMNRAPRGEDGENSRSRWTECYCQPSRFSTAFSGCPSGGLQDRYGFGQGVCALRVAG